MIRTLVLAAAALATLSAQETTRQTFRVGAEMVVVDLVATDRNGTFISDLQPSDIQLTEDGKPRRVEFLRLVRTTERSDTPPAAGLAAPIPTPTDDAPAKGAAPPPDAGLIILVDLASMPIEALPRVKTAIHALLREDLPSGVPMMLATMSQSLTVGRFTTDRATIDAAVDAIPSAARNNRTLMDVVEHLDMLCDTAALNIERAAIGEGRALINENRTRLLAVTESLTLLSRALSSRSGRKQIVLYSAGYFVDANYDIADILAAAAGSCGGNAKHVQMELRTRERDVLGAAEKAIDRANRAQVSFYAVDPRGLFVPAPGAERKISARMMHSDASRQAGLIEGRTQEYLRVVSSGTGGQSYVNNNDMARGLRRAWLDATEYYLIGYMPPENRKKGEFHKISLKVARNDASVRYRQGYYDATDQEIAEADIGSALRHPETFPDQDLRAEASVQDGTLKVSALIPPARIRFTQVGDVRQATFSIHAALRDAKGAIVEGKPLFGRDVSLNLKPERFTALMDSDTVEIPTQAKAPPPGTYQLVVVVRDSGGWIATRTIDLTIPQ